MYNIQPVGGEGLETSLHSQPCWAEPRSSPAESRWPLTRWVVNRPRPQAPPPGPPPDHTARHPPDRRSVSCVRSPARRRVPDPDVQGPEDLRQGGRGRRHGNQDGVALRGSADEDRAEEVGRVWPRLLVGREELSVSVATASGHANDKMTAGPLGLVGGA